MLSFAILNKMNMLTNSHVFLGQMKKYITYMQSTSCEMPGWMKHKLESRLQGGISITSDMQKTPPLWQKELKSLLMKVKEENEKADLKLNIQKATTMASGPITSW